MRNSDRLQLPEVYSLDGIPRVPRGHLEEPNNDYERARRAYKSIPHEVHVALEYWAFQGLPPAKWLVAVLASDMYSAVEYAPPIMIGQVSAIASMLKTFYPCMCYGSADAVVRWCDASSLHMLDLPCVLQRMREIEDGERPAED